MQNRVNDILSLYPIDLGVTNLNLVRSFRIDNNKLDDNLVNWFANYDPINFNIPWIVDRLELTKFSDLMEVQEGYRWDINTGKVDSNWDDNWLVIGQDSGDPIIYNLDNKEIYSAVHGVGLWDLKLLSTNLEEFLLFIKSWLLALSNYDYKSLDENYLPNKAVFEEFKNNLLKSDIELTKYNNFLELA